MKMKRLISMMLALTMTFTMVTGALAADDKLRYNDRGAAVTQLQQMLSQLGYSVAVDGVFGPGTETAVKNFQAANSLKVDGIAGSATLTLLRALTGTSGSAQPSQSGSAQGLFGGVYTPMRPGESSSRVRVLQKALNTLGYNAGVEDAVYGRGTEAAVRWFQQMQNLTVDGKAGEKTLKRIESFFNADGTLRSDYTTPAVTAAPSTTTAPGVTGTGLFGGNYEKMIRGEVSSRVRVLQNALNALGYNVGAADAVYGTGTEAAVRLFQIMQGLTVDGKAGEKTLKRIESFFNADGTLRSDYAPPANLPTSAPTTAPSVSGGAPTRTLRPGDSGDDVRSVQARLQELGYYAGVLDGYYGAGTTLAVTQFQLRHNIGADGKAGTVTNAILFSANAMAASVTTAPDTAAPTAGPTTAPTAAPTTAPSAGGNLFGGVYTKMVRGEVSSRVRTLQNALNALGYSVGAADAVYGAATEAAVRLFQQRFGLTVDGKAGENTLRMIESCFNADGTVKSDYAPSVTTAPAQPTATPSLTIPSRILRPGDSGEDVRNVQVRLQALGYYTGALDGQYGTGTTSAVFQFQLRNGIYADGKAGTDTNMRLFSDSAIAASDVTAAPTTEPTATPTAAPTAVPTAVPTATPTAAPQYVIPTRTLNLGDTGEDVRSVQSRLQALGYYTGALDGVYGSGTVSAVIAFQQAHNLSVDGKAGTVTNAILFSDNAKPVATSAPGNAATTAPATNTTLRRGDSGEAVTQLQAALLNLGYTVNTNGSYTNETVTAVKQFQSANGLNVDGIAGPNTLTKLYSGTAAGPSASTDGPGTTTAGVMSNPPSNSQIQLLHWYNDIKPYLSGQPIVQIYDPASKLTWNIKIFSKGQHADGEPPTLQDTQIMDKAFGNQFTWNEKPVFVKLPSGVWCIASMHDRPHEADMISPSINGFEIPGVSGGHLCIHFPRDMVETEKNAPKNGVRHQNDIRKKWKEMTGQDIPW